LIPIGGDWQTWGFTVREQVFKIGPILAAGIDFLVVAWLVYHFSKKVLREETVAKK
jgi:large-conductance mechanosensitive channel